MSRRFGIQFERDQVSFETVFAFFGRMWHLLIESAKTQPAYNFDPRAASRCTGCGAPGVRGLCPTCTVAHVTASAMKSRWWDDWGGE